MSDSNLGLASDPLKLCDEAWCPVRVHTPPMLPEPHRPRSNPLAMALMFPILYHDEVRSIGLQ
jgi:hypothetical protein